MKKYIVPTLLVILIVLQLVSLSRMEQLKNELNNTKNQLSNLATSQSGQLSMLTANINQMLSKQASMIDHFEYAFGEFDQSRMTLPVTFKVVPKEVTPDARMTLDVSGERIAMDRSGTTFTATLPVGIFTKFEASVILTDNGSDKSEKLAVSEHLRFRLLPTVFAHFEGDSVMNYTKSADSLSGAYHRSGKIALDVKPVENNTIEKARLVFEVDGEIIKEMPINTGGMSTEFDQRLSLAAGQHLVVSIEAIDSFGLIHRVIVEKFSLNGQAEHIPEDDWMWMDEAIIKHPDGTVLFNPLGDKMLP